jgi:hypothetical protein
MVAAFGTVALVGVLVTLAALVTLHILPTGLSPLRDPVSAYGISRVRGLYRAQTLGTAVAAAALAVAVVAASLESAVPLIVALVVLALTRGVISWVPMDAEGAARTGTGRAHNLLAFGAFAAASVAGFMGGIALGATEGYDSAAGVSTALGWFMTGASALTLLAAAVRGLRGMLGFAERLIYAGMLVWLTFVAIVLVIG